MDGWIHSLLLIRTFEKEYRTRHGPSGCCHWRDHLERSLDFSPFRFLFRRWTAAKALHFLWLFLIFNLFRWYWQGSGFGFAFDTCVQYLPIELGGGRIVLDPYRCCANVNAVLLQKFVALLIPAHLHVRHLFVSPSVHFHGSNKR